MEIFPPEYPIPSEEELEIELGIARATARRVARELREQALVYTIQGKGTFVGKAGTPHRPHQTPIYQQIAEEIIAQIQQGELPPHQIMPSEKMLVRRHGVAKATVRQAVRFLREQGWAYTVPYRGTYPAGPEKWPVDEKADQR